MADQSARSEHSGAPRYHCLIPLFTRFFACLTLALAKFNYVLLCVLIVQSFFIGNRFL
jgi:hypothetical protein